MPVTSATPTASACDPTKAAVTASSTAGFEPKAEARPCAAATVKK
eukprot:gene7914-5043_t